jgi:uncharacterized membrane protein YdjX (TVP38/TMEM64 family)
VVVGRIIAILAIVILGSIAAEELFKFLMSILPLLTILMILAVLLSGWMRRRRRF